MHPSDRLGQWIDNDDEESMIIIIICQWTTSPLVCWWYNFSTRHSCLQSKCSKGEQCTCNAHFCTSHRRRHYCGLNLCSRSTQCSAEQVAHSGGEKNPTRWRFVHFIMRWRDCRFVTNWCLLTFMGFPHFFVRFVPLFHSLMLTPMIIDHSY